MTLSRRLLLGALLTAPALRRPRAQAAHRIRIIHTNDFHSRHESVARATGAACRANDTCLGGSARLAGGVAAARSEAAAAGRAVVAVDAGDQFMGSLFYTQHRGAAELAVMRAWGCEAMTLGNHEFDNGPEVLARFAAGADFPILAANIDATAEPLLAGRIRPWFETVRGGARIAFLGVITPETPQLSSPGRNLRFTDPAEAATRAIAAIRAQGPATIVLLSHLGLGADRRIAEQVAGIDAIIGGHSHTLLAGEPDADGPSPTLVDGRDRTVRIVQTGAFGRFLGRLDLDLATDGRIAAQGGSTIPLGAGIPEDARVAALVAELARPLEETRRRAVGRLPAALSNDRAALRQHHRGDGSARRGSAGGDRARGVAGRGHRGPLPPGGGHSLRLGPDGATGQPCARCAGRAGHRLSPSRPRARLSRGDQRLHAQGRRRLRDVPRPRDRPL